MTVAELITQLEKVEDKNKAVYFWSDEDEVLYPVEACKETTTDPVDEEGEIPILMLSF